MSRSSLIVLTAAAALLAFGGVLVFRPAETVVPVVPCEGRGVDEGLAAEGAPGSRPRGRPVEAIKAVPYLERAADSPAEVATDGATTDGIIVAGEVTDWDGSPAADVGLSMFSMQDGVPVGTAVERAATDDRGRFKFAQPLPPDLDCVLGAFKPGRRPATVLLAFHTAEPKNALRLALGAGAAIEGTVTLDGKPVRSARVSATMQGCESGSFTASDLLWSGTAFENKRAAVYGDEQGRFTMRGLASAMYRVETEPLVSEISVGMVSQVDVLAPASGVHLGVHSGRVRIRIVSEGVWLPDARVALVDPQGLRIPIPPKFELPVAAGNPFTLEAGHLGFVPKRVTVAALAPGETRDVDVELDPDGRPDLRLKLRGALEMPLENIAVRFFPVTGPEETIGVLSELRRDLQARREKDDEFVLKHVPYPAGTYVMALLPDPPRTWFVPIKTEITLPANGSVELALDVVRGGRLAVRVVNSDFTGVDYVVRNAAGVEVYSSAVSRGRSDHYDAQAEASALLRSTLMFAPGTYEIEAKSQGSRTLREIVVIADTKTTDKFLRLEPEGP